MTGIKCYVEIYMYIEFLQYAACELIVLKCSVARAGGSLTHLLV